MRSPCQPLSLHAALSTPTKDCVSRSRGAAREPRRVGQRRRSLAWPGRRRELQRSDRGSPGAERLFLCHLYIYPSIRIIRNPRLTLHLFPSHNSHKQAETGRRACGCCRAVARQRLDCCLACSVRAAAPRPGRPVRPVRTRFNRSTSLVDPIKTDRTP